MPCLFLGDDSTQKWEINGLRDRAEVAVVTPHSVLPGRPFRDYRLAPEDAEELGLELIEQARRVRGLLPLPWLTNIRKQIEEDRMREVA